MNRGGNCRLAWSTLDATVDYVIQPQAESMDEMLRITNSETLESLELKIHVAMGSSLVSLTEISQPSVAMATTAAPSTSTSTYCPGHPVCGGIFGQCVADDGSWRCQCSETYEGEACELRACPSCNNGTCIPGTQSPHSPWTCECPEGSHGTSSWC
eukprot:Skav201882  [mRNA]  locus=scaffold550:258028:260162:- [translate_table: standard]